MIYHPRCASSREIICNDYFIAIFFEDISEFLDHFATYTIDEKDLTAFIDRHFEIEDSFSERSLVDSDRVGKAMGRMDWIVPEGSVWYSYSASNGGVSNYYHDPATGSTYQDSAHW